MAKINLNKQLIRELNQLLEETGLCEIEISEGRQSVRVSRPSVSKFTTPTTSDTVIRNDQHVQLEPSRPDKTDVENSTGVVKSPMVGTVYLSPKPDDPPFVIEGDEVSEGQSIMIIEAMKVMNPIPAPQSGKITKIFVTDKQSVEFGEPLMIVE